MTMVDEERWCITKFTKDNSISLIPRSWWIGKCVAINEKGHIYWPRTGQFSKIKKQTPPSGEEWDLYEGVLKMSAVIKSHDEGMELEKQFEDMQSNLEEDEYIANKFTCNSRNIVNASFTKVLRPQSPLGDSFNRLSSQEPSPYQLAPNSSTPSSLLISSKEISPPITSSSTAVDILLTLSQFQAEMVQHEKRIQDMIQVMLYKALAEHHQNMQALINDKFNAYEKVFTRGMSASALDITRTEMVNDDGDNRSFDTKFKLPLDTIEELLLWNTEIKNEPYHKFMKELMGQYIGSQGKNPKPDEAAFECFSRLLSIDLMVKLSWSGVSRTSGVGKFKFSSMDNTIDFITSSVQKASNTSWMISNTKKAFADLVLKNSIKKKRNDHKSSSTTSKKIKIDDITNMTTPISKIEETNINTPHEADLISTTAAETLTRSKHPRSVNKPFEAYT